MDWIKITVNTTSEGIEPVCACLISLGICGLEIEDEADFKEFLENNRQYWDYVDEELIKEKSKQTCVSAYVSDNIYGNEILLSVREAIKALKNSDKDGLFGQLDINIGNVCEEDWANNWKKYFHTTEIGKRIMIKPEWEEPEKTTDRIVFSVNPGMTFGTGSHYTTRLCIEELENYAEDKNVLDLGCGSGILSIISLMLGANSALAVDIDPNCIKVFEDNAKRNNIDNDKYEVIAGNIIEDKNVRDYILKNKYSLILANIVADVIISALDVVKRAIADDGIFICSGIIEDRIEDVKQALCANGFKILKIRRAKDWAAMVCEKSCDVGI